MTESAAPALSVVIPTFNNVAVLQRCLESWQAFADLAPVELVVIEDGCRDATADYLARQAASPWGQRHLRWCHEGNVHELCATNRGLREARAPLVMTWHDDMFLRGGWLVPEILDTFARRPELGLLCLSRGLVCRALRRADRGLGGPARLAPPAEHDRPAASSTGSACRKWTR